MEFKQPEHSATNTNSSFQIVAYVVSQDLAKVFDYVYVV